MNSNILLLYILLVFDSIISESIFSENSSHRESDEVPEHLKEYNYNLICKLQPNGFNCGNENDAMKSKFYFDTVMKTCMTFWHGNCGFSLNKFNTLEECNGKCLDSILQITSKIKNLTDNLRCRLQPEFGNCRKYMPMYYFDITTRKCTGFSYSGCGGNSNRFVTESLCNEVCYEAVSISQKVLKDRGSFEQQWNIDRI